MILLAKTIQIRVQDNEHALIKAAFGNENISKMVRDFLLEEAKQKLKDSDVSLQSEDSTIHGFLEVLSNPAVQQTLYAIFQKSNKE